MAVSGAGLLGLGDVRQAAALALAPVDAGDPSVYMDVVDSLEPPALMLLWDDPWLELETSCIYQSRLLVLAVAGRLEPGEGIAKLEQLVAFTIGRLRADSYDYVAVGSGAPRVFEIGGVPYLGARVSFAVRVGIQADAG